MEVAGPLAMFARPDTGGTPTSYPAPTWSAAKGLFESIAFLADGAAWICPVRVEVCRPRGTSGGQMKFERYTTNYGGPMRKPALFTKGTAVGGSSMQLFSTVLADVCYRLHGIVVGGTWLRGNDPRHHLQDLFARRLAKGQCFRTPCFGWSEFTCSYWGPIRLDVTEVDADLSMEIPSMLLAVWSSPSTGSYEPLFRQDVRVEAGVLKYHVPDEWLARSLTGGDRQC
jgi:CRISPR-associated protein Cas5d